MRRGLVLLELMVVLIVIGIVALFAVPRLRDVADTAAVRNETFRVVAALEAARGAAVRLDNVATLSLADTAYRVAAVVGSDTVLAWYQPGPERTGVTLSGAGTPIQFGPAGLAMGVANRTITLSRGKAARRVVLSRLGRVTY